MKFRNAFFMILFVGYGFTLNAQISFENLQVGMSMEKRYIVMNISSRSCIYCLMQEKKMQKDKVLQERLKNEVYFLSWQTEQQVCFIFNGQKYASGEEFIENYGRDENGTIAYPLWLIFDENYRIIYRYFGLLSTEKITKLLDVLKEK